MNSPDNREQLDKMNKSLEEIRDIQKHTARSGQIKLIFAGLSLIVSIFGIINSYFLLLAPGFMIWLFAVIMVFLLFIIVLQINDAIPFPVKERKRRQKQLQSLMEIKELVDLMLVSTPPDGLKSMINTYYNVLRSVCTIFREDAPSLFDDILWSRWQLEKAPKQFPSLD